MKRIPFVALAVAAVLIVLWSQFGGGEGPAPLPPAGTKREAATSSGERIDAPLAAAESAPGAHRTSRTEVDTSAPMPGNADAGEGRRVVHGRLVDSQGGPLADLEVSLATIAYDDDRIVVPPPSRARSDPEDPRTRTAGDGTFSFSVVPGRVGRLVMEDEEWALSGTRHFEAPEGDVDLGEITALGTGSVSGTVVDAAGRPVEGVRVAAGHGDPGLHGFGADGHSAATTDDEGRFTVGRLRPGEIWLRTASPSFLPAEAELHLREGEERTGVDLRVEPGAAIAGQVLDDLGHPVSGIKVGARRKAEHGNVSIERYTPDEATVTDRHGLFTLAGIEGDTAQVRAWGEGYATAVESNVPVGTGNLTLHVSRLGVVEGILVGEDGGPIPGSRVRAQGAGGAVFERPDDLPLLPGMVVARTAEDGRFRLEGVPPGTVTVRATGKGHRPAVLAGITVLPGEVTKDVRLVGSRGTAVEATVLDPSGEPVAGAKVRVVDPPSPSSDGSTRRRMGVREDENGEVAFHDGTEVTLGSAVTDAGGKATVGGLPPKPVQVRAEHDDFAEAEPAALVLPPGGKVEAELILREAGSALVRVFASGEPVPSARFQLRGPRAGAEEGRKWRGVTDAAGEARMGSLPPGPYMAELELETPGRSMGTFTVVGGARALPESRVEFTIAARETTQVDLHRPILATVRGSVRDANGPVSGAVIEMEPVEEEGPGAAAGVHSARSTADGSYAIADLCAGRYLMRYGRSDQVVKAEEFVEIPARAEVEKDLVLRGGVLRITALSAGGAEPVEGAEVTLEPTGGPASGRSPRRVVIVAVAAGSGGGETMRVDLGDNSTRTGADGVAEIRDVPPASYDVRIRHDDYATFELPGQVVVDRGVTDCGTAELAPAGILTGRVRDAQGGDLRLAMVEYWRADRPEDRETVSAMNGGFRLTGLTPGRYHLRARRVPLRPGPMDTEFGPDREVEVRAGRNPPLGLRTR